MSKWHSDPLLGHLKMKTANSKEEICINTEAKFIKNIKQEKLTSPIFLLLYNISKIKTFNKAMSLPWWVFISNARITKIFQYFVNFYNFFVII